MRLELFLTTLIAVASTLAGTALGMQDVHQHAHQHAQATVGAGHTAFGEPGKARDVTRTIDLSLLDTMIIVPARLAVTQGQTVRLRIKNSGKMTHEFVLGTRADITEHWQMMKAMPKMRHAEANAVSVAPGSTAEIVWRFSEPGKFLYVCLLPLHWEAGMQGVVSVSSR